VWSCQAPTLTQEVLVAHRNAPLSELGRLRLARVIVDQGWPVARAAERFQVSRPTAGRWASDIAIRGRPGWPIGPAARITHLGGPRRRWCAGSSICAGLSGSGRPRSLPRWGWPLDRACRPGPLPHQPPGPSGPGHRPADPPLRARPSRRPHPCRRQEARQHPRWGRPSVPGPGRRRPQPPGADRSSGQTSRYRNALTGHGFIHAAVDDHSRLAYAEIHPDETRETAAGFLARAQAWFADRGVVIQRVLTDNGGCDRSHRWHQICQQLAITPKRTRPYRPQTNGKVERFNRTPVTGPTGGSMPVKLPAGPRSGPGCTGIPTTGPTAHSADAHQSPAAPTSPSLTTRDGCGRRR